MGSLLLFSWENEELTGEDGQKAEESKKLVEDQTSQNHLRPSLQITKIQESLSPPSQFTVLLLSHSPN